MAAGCGRTEIPDSEDEPMTSSPVNAMDGAADKLSATAPVPPQDAQDAQDTLQEAARTHQGRTDGLSADHEIASIDVDALKIDQTNMQLETSAGSCDAEAHSDNPPSPVPEGSVHPALQADDSTVQPHSTASHVTSDGEQQTKPVAKVTSATNMSLPVPGAGTRDKMVDAEFPLESTGHESTLGCTGACSHAAELEVDDVARIPDAEQKPSTSSRMAIGSFMSDDDRVKGEGEAQSTDSHELNSSLNNPTTRIDRPSGPDLTIPTEDRTSTDSRCGANDDSRAHVEDHELTQDVEDAATPLRLSSLDPQVKGDPVDTEMSDVTLIQVERKSSQMPSLHPNEESTQVDGNIQSNCSTSTMAPATVKTDNDVFQASGQADFNLSETRESLKSSPTNATTVDAQPETQAHDAADVNSGSHITTMTPQEVTLAELKAQKAAFLAALACLPAIQVLMEEKATSDAEISDGDDEPTEADIMAAANKIVKDHIKLLHEYNELKDVGQGLMGLIADQRGVRIIEVQEEFGIDAKD
ncbi:Swi5-domain-containing protein [Ophiobolus disseminans]|uniref:Swi5-domain-containing protein n=1 Tax=Ophiobolus disseminans TaxID=1469910 RepID=A0A6A6ZSN5_9PLEO|nr:Swi5-domain-containing protein [Ophiobolus disseminans]